MAAASCVVFPPGRRAEVENPLARCRARQSAYRHSAGFLNIVKPPPHAKGCFPRPVRLPVIETGPDAQGTGRSSKGLIL